MLSTKAPKQMTFEVSKHPLIQHKVSQLRNRKTTPKEFRSLVREITSILAAKATEDLELISTGMLISSPMSEYAGVELKDRVGIFPILRAGLGMVEPFLQLFPDAEVRHLGLYREKKTLLPVEYYNKLPTDCLVETGIVVDPMVATAGTAISAINILKDWGLTKIKFVCVLGSAEGLAALKAEHPDVQVYAAAQDEHLNDEGYVLPGLGDAGDRIFNTVRD